MILELLRYHRAAKELDPERITALVAELKKLLAPIGDDWRPAEARALIDAIVISEELETAQRRLEENKHLDRTVYGIWPGFTFFHQGRQALESGVRSARDVREGYLEVGSRELMLAHLETCSDASIRHLLLTDTRVMIAVLATLHDESPTRLGERLRGVLGVITALATPMPPRIEHEAPPAGATSRPLLEHLERALGRKLRGLEYKDQAVFERSPTLSAAAFQREAQRLADLSRHGVKHDLHAALLHLDFAKGGSLEQRARWKDRGVDLSVHNRAATRILEGPGLGEPSPLDAYEHLRGRRDREIVLQLVRAHGMVGQAVRGETPLAFFFDLIEFLKSEGDGLAASLRCGTAEARRLVIELLHAIDVIDTAAVREDLLDDALLTELEAVEEMILELALEPALDDVQQRQRLQDAEEQLWRSRIDPLSADPIGEMITARLLRLRASRQRAGEPDHVVKLAVAKLSAPAKALIWSLLKNVQLWYVEAATAALSADAQLKLLALALRAATESDAIDTGAPFDISFEALADSLGRGADPRTAYRLRLVETALDPISVDQILLSPEGAGALLASERASPVLCFAVSIGGGTGIAIRAEESDEASALITLLPIYEKKSSAAFHATLKTLSDLYGLRKDDFDRINNESLYLAHMNSARSDKSRMLDFVEPGRIVEVGPGGGVVLDLCVDRFPKSEVIGIDVSSKVVEVLEARRKQEQRPWKVVLADAFALADHVGAGSVSTVIFCSILHEIYSYVERDGARFHLESVRDILRAAYRALRPGGRIVIRDGVMPVAGVRRLRFVVPDAREMFLLFAEQFEGRKIRWTEITRDTIELSSADAMEFMYTYTWGPESFPYEVREQYGVLPYAEYTRSILEWLAIDRDAPPALVPIPPGMDSYLQSGYERGLAGKVELFHADNSPARLFDSNCLIVIRKG